MSTRNPQHRWFELFGAASDGQLDTAQNEELQQILKTEPEARRLWYLFNDLEAGLVETLSENRLAQTTPLDEDAEIVRRSWRRPVGIALAAAAAIALTLVALRDTSNDPMGVELTILECAEPILTSGPVDWAAGDKLTLPRIELTEGSVRFSPAPSTYVTATAPVSLELINSNHIRVHHGKVTAEATPGFTVDTQRARFVDLGTQFGVEVTPGGQTSLVVFDGEVEVHEPSAKSKSLIATIPEGQALGIGDQGHLSAIDSILTNDDIDGWSIAQPPAETAIISAVSDNVVQLTGNHFYPIFNGGLVEGVRAFPYQKATPRWWGTPPNGLPSFLQGADFVQTLQEERNNPDLEITVTLARPSDLYIFFDAKANPPSWLQQDFELTNSQLVLCPEPPPLSLNRGKWERPLRIYNVWKKQVTEAGTVKLGSTERPARHTPPFYMYGIAATKPSQSTER